MCTGNTNKSTIGDAADCNTDTPCDGVTDANHTHCGLYTNILFTIECKNILTEWILMNICYGNKLIFF